MKMFERLREWASSSDDEKMQMDRRAFLRGMAVTSAGLLVPGATVFDLGTRPPDAERFVREWMDKVSIDSKLKEIVRMYDFELVSWDYVEKSVIFSANLKVAG